METKQRPLEFVCEYKIICYFIVLLARKTTERKVKFYKTRNCLG